MASIDGKKQTTKKEIRCYGDSARATDFNVLMDL
jgi:hypothetical protein